MNREEYIDCLSKCDIVVDINHSTQTGLSMRVTETYGAGKKLLTTNKSIQKDPLYNRSWAQTFDLNDIELSPFEKQDQGPLCGGPGIRATLGSRLRPRRALRPKAGGPRRRRAGARGGLRGAQGLSGPDGLVRLRELRRPVHGLHRVWRAALHGLRRGGLRRPDRAVARERA